MRRLSCPYRALWPESDSECARLPYLLALRGSPALFWSAVFRIALPSLVPLIYPVSVEQELQGMQVNSFVNR